MFLNTYNVGGDPRPTLAQEIEFYSKQVTRKYLSDVCRDEHEHETFEAELACHLRRNDVDNNGYAVTPDSKPFGTLLLTDFYRMQAEQAAKSAAEAAEEEAKAKVEEAVTRPLYAAMSDDEFSKVEPSSAGERRAYFAERDAREEAAEAAERKARREADDLAGVDDDKVTVR
jgi:hypothetical protein